MRDFQWLAFDDRSQSSFQAGLKSTCHNIVMRTCLDQNREVNIENEKVKYNRPNQKSEKVGYALTIEGNGVNRLVGQSNPKIVRQNG